MNVQLTILQKQKIGIVNELVVVSQGTIDTKDAIYWIFDTFNNGAKDVNRQLRLEVLINKASVIEIGFDRLDHMAGLVETDQRKRSATEAYVYRFEGTFEYILQLQDMLKLLSKDRRFLGHVFQRFNGFYSRSSRETQSTVAPPQSPVTSFRGSPRAKMSTGSRPAR